MIAVSKSGTVSLEICNSKVPSIIIYKINFINYLIMKSLVKVNFANIINIINNKEISIFNNNAISTIRGKNILSNSKVLIYNLEKNKFYKKFSESMHSNNVKTAENGLSEILNDGSMLVEETDQGRILMFDSGGDLEWEFVNKGKNGKVYNLWWSRIIEDEISLNLRRKFRNSSCSN